MSEETFLSKKEIRETAMSCGVSSERAEEIAEKFCDSPPVSRAEVRRIVFDPLFKAVKQSDE